MFDIIVERAPGTPVEGLFLNPSRQEIEELLKKENGCRGLYDLGRTNVYLWRADACMHGGMIDWVGLDKNTVRFLLMQGKEVVFVDYNEAEYKGIPQECLDAAHRYSRLRQERYAAIKEQYNNDPKCVVPACIEAIVEEIRTRLK